MTKAPKNQLMSLAALGDTHDGRTGQNFNGEIFKAVQDCIKRQHIDKARSIPLQVDIFPGERDQTGDLETVSYEVRIKPAKLPNFEPLMRERAQVQKNGQLLLLFEPHDED